MADKLTPEELAEIYKTHEEDQKGLDADAENGLIVLPPWSAHPHRAALLRHVEALEQEVERLREFHAGMKSDAEAMAEMRAEAAERKLARVREPTEEMIDAGRKAFNEALQIDAPDGWAL